MIVKLSERLFLIMFWEGEGAKSGDKRMNGDNLPPLASKGGHC